MILRQTLHTSPAVASSYLFGCGSRGVGVVVDPVADPQFYLDSASELGLQIRYVIDTHVHADHISTGRALADAADAAYGARALYESARRLKRLADHIEVLPGAFAGSVCGRGLSGKTTSTIGFERRFNKPFAIEDRQEFVAAMVRDIPPPPPNAAGNRSSNLGHVDVESLVMTP